MSRTKTLGVFGAILAVIALSQLISSSNASAGIGGKKIFDQTGAQCCPECNHVCNLEAKMGEEEKTCFDVESKVICIPRVAIPWDKVKVSFPWRIKKCGSCDGGGCDSCSSPCDTCNSCDGSGCDTCSSCPNLGARTREICVLKTVKYKCPKCKYTWSTEKKPCVGCDSGCATSCDSGCDTGCDIEYTEAAPSTVWTPVPLEEDQPSSSSSNASEKAKIETDTLPAPASK